MGQDVKRTSTSLATNANQFHCQASSTRGKCKTRAKLSSCLQTLSVVFYIVYTDPPTVKMNPFFVLVWTELMMFCALGGPDQSWTYNNCPATLQCQFGFNVLVWQNKAKTVKPALYSHYCHVSEAACSQPFLCLLTDLQGTLKWFSTVGNIFDEIIPTVREFSSREHGIENKRQQWSWSKVKMEHKYFVILNSGEKKREKISEIAFYLLI